MVTTTPPCCRLCLSSDNSMLDIFGSSPSVSSVSFLDKIHTCLPIKIEAEDEYSKSVCKPCWDKVDQYYDFWVLIELSQKQLKNVTKNARNNVTSEGEESFDQKETSCDPDIANVVSSTQEENTPAPEQDHAEEYVCRDCGIHGIDFNLKPKTPNQPCIVCQQVELTKAGTKLRKYECSVCTYSNSSMSNFKIHMKKHNGEFVAECHHCGKGFYSRAACNEHESVKHDLQVAKNRCNECDKRYNSKSYLRLHQKTHDLNFDKAHQCETCGKTYWSRRALKRHELVAHLGQVYRCGVCDKEVKSLESLKNHLKIHEGEKPFVCSTCGHSFRTRNGLTVHERVHTGSKPFKCSLCEQSFTQSSSLKIHVRYHKGDRPFCCAQCDKRYVTATHLKNHMKSHTKITEK